MDTLHYVQRIAFHGKLECFRCLSSNADQGNNYGTTGRDRKVGIQREGCSLQKIKKKKNKK